MDGSNAALAGWVAFVALVSALGWYFALRINRGVLRGRPWQMELFCAVVVAVAGYSLWSGPGVAAGIAASIALVLGLAFLGLASMAGLPQRVAVEVGSEAPDFQIADATGAVFSLSGHRGELILLKFFRGHW